MKVRAPSADSRYFEVQNLIHGQSLHTICEEARCPNISECWGRGTATFQILGDTCTRACRYCYVNSGKPEHPPDPLEPLRLAQTAAQMGLKHVVVTSVDRDDVPDRGAAHYAATIRALKSKMPEASVEVLTPDFLGVEEEALRTVLAARPEVFNHNIETVRRLHRRMRGAKASYDKALWLLARAKELADYPVLTKSGIIVGLGERNDEVVETMRDLREHAVDVVTIGQYLQPSSKHAQIDRWVHPDEFRWFREQGEELGFGSVFLPSGRAAPRGRDGPRRRRLLTEARLGAELPVLEADLVRGSRSGDAVVPALEVDALHRRVGLRRRLTGEAAEAVRREIRVDLVELGGRKLRRALRRRRPLVAQRFGQAIAHLRIEEDKRGQNHRREHERSRNSRHARTFSAARATLLPNGEGRLGAAFSSVVCGAC
jgi:lipoic acid synthetase